MRMSEARGEESGWNCSLCSFLNHSALNTCEMCEGPRKSGPVTLDLLETPVKSIASEAEEPTIVFQMDDCSCSSGLVDLLEVALRRSKAPYALSTPYCCHFSQRDTFGAAWSCGYRNIQMICSALMQRKLYREKLFSGVGRMPNIRLIQEWIEQAWKDGFDSAGSSHFGGKLVGTREWIGTTECCALLRFFGLRARIVDFQLHDNGDKKRKYTPEEIAAGQGVSSHIEAWLREYFKASVVQDAKSYFSPSKSTPVSTTPDRNKFLPPLYFQHDGHSRTIVGITKSGEEVVPLVFDPASSGKLMRVNLQEATTSSCRKWHKQIRRSVDRLNKCEYQILFVEEGLMGDEEREESKVIDSVDYSTGFVNRTDF